MTPGEGQVIVVRHGAGRGRGRRYLDPFLHHVASQGVDLHRRLRVHDTGSGKADLNGVSAVFFYLGDPLRELYPDCYAEAMCIADEAHRRGIPLIHHPDRLSDTAKSVQSKLWRDAGIPTPPHYAFSGPDELDDALAMVEFPAFVRADLRHGQKGMALCQTASEARALAARNLLWYPGTLTPFVDTRAGYQVTDPSTIWAKFFHKRRLLVAGDAVLPESILFSSSPIVAAPSSYFQSRLVERQGRRGAKWLRSSAHRLGLGLAPVVHGLAVGAGFPHRLRKSVRAAVAEDVAYGSAGDGHEELVRKATAVLGLHVAAVDYTALADGGVVLWEANPYFDLLPSGVPLESQRQSSARFARYHHALGDLLWSFPQGHVDGHRNVANQADR